MRSPVFEIVRTDAPQPWHARFRAANGRVVWVTETYTRRRGAVKAVTLIRSHSGLFLPEVREVDEG